MSEIWYQYAVYRNPADYPGKFVVRRWGIHPDKPHPVPEEKPICVEDTYGKVLEHIPTGLFRVPHQTGREDPVIMETWL